MAVVGENVPSKIGSYFHSERKVTDCGCLQVLGGLIVRSVVRYNLRYPLTVRLVSRTCLCAVHPFLQ